jgi:hypothetical protein
MVTEYPLEESSFPKEAAIIPFPNDDVTPPVTNKYLVADFANVLFFNYGVQSYEKSDAI